MPLPLLIGTSILGFLGAAFFFALVLAAVHVIVDNVQKKDWDNVTVAVFILLFSVGIALSIIGVLMS